MLQTNVVWRARPARAAAFGGAPGGGRGIARGLAHDWEDTFSPEANKVLPKKLADQEHVSN